MTPLSDYRWLTAAAAADAEEDRLYGDKRGDEMPDWVADKEKRLAKIRAAKAELEAEAKAAASLGLHYGVAGGRESK
jgi:hypothetical protein